MTVAMHAAAVAQLKTTIPAILVLIVAILNRKLATLLAPISQHQRLQSHCPRSMFNLPRSSGIHRPAFSPPKFSRHSRRYVMSVQSSILLFELVSLLLGAMRSDMDTTMAVLPKEAGRIIAGGVAIASGPGTVTTTTHIVPIATTDFVVAVHSNRQSRTSPFEVQLVSIQTHDVSDARLLQQLPLTTVV